MIHQDTASTTFSPRRKAVRARQQFIKSNKELLEALDKENPGATKDQLIALACEKLLGDPDRAWEAAHFQLSYLYPGVVERKGKPATAPPSPEEREAEEAEARAKVKDAIARRVLLASKFNGVELLDMTREDLERMGGWQRRLAEKLKPGQTVREGRVTQKQLDGIVNG